MTFHTFRQKVSIVANTAGLAFSSSTLLFEANVMPTTGIDLLGATVSDGSVVSIGPGNSVGGQLFVSGAYLSSSLFVVGNAILPATAVSPALSMSSVTGNNSLLTVADNTVRTTGARAAMVVMPSVRGLCTMLPTHTSTAPWLRRFRRAVRWETPLRFRAPQRFLAASHAFHRRRWRLLDGPDPLISPLHSHTAKRPLEVSAASMFPSRRVR